MGERGDLSTYERRNDTMIDPLKTEDKGAIKRERKRLDAQTKWNKTIVGDDM